MTRHHGFVRSIAIAGACTVGLVLGVGAADPPHFKPDGSFKGSTLTGWHAVGDAEWTAQNGEIVGKAKSGTSGGWLVLDKSFQDVHLYLNYKCTGECKSGVLLRAKKAADGSTTGVLVSLADGDTGYYSVTLDANGRETSRDQLGAPGRGGGDGSPAGSAARGGGAAADAGTARGGRSGRGADAAAAPAQTAPPARGTQVGSAGRARPTLKAGEWNAVDIRIGQEGPPSNSSAGTAGPHQVLSSFGPTPRAALDEKNARGFGTIALYAGGSGEVRFKDLAWKDLMRVAASPEKVSPRFAINRLNTAYYGWGAITSDVNHDGALDVISGPFYYLGPDFTEQRRYRDGPMFNPESSFAPDMVNLSADFTGDGWPDVLSSLGNRHMDLYVNPAGESRRWDKFSVLPTISSEIVLMKDLDQDGKPEIIFGQAVGSGGYAWAKPDLANPTAVWTAHSVWAPGQAVNGHGLGVGDVNGDGRRDIVVPTGWYEQPAAGIGTSPWPFHEAELSDPAVFGSGGGEMGVYDVNGDGLADVVAGTGHNWGLNWFEQKKDGTFVRHNIAQDFSTAATNMGGVVFSESHGARFADMDGDRIPDMITGKRYWSEAGNNVLTHNDPSGDPVLYIYKTVRDPKAPGRARFVPELVHNKSGVGSSFDVVDLNKDGKLDIVVATVFGTFTFTSKGAAPAAPNKGMDGGAPR
jgi:hypothetical protein